MSLEGKKQDSSKFLIFIILLALVVCFIAILIWINAIGNKREKAMESLKASIAKSTHVPAVPLVVVNEEDLSVESIDISEVEFASEATENEVIEQTDVVSSKGSAISYSPVSNSGSLFHSADKVVFEKYTVREGDSLASIASAYNLRTQTLVSVNSLKTVYPPIGSILLIPNQDGQFYTVQEGDTFFSIAQRFSLAISWKTLREINGLDNENLKIGMLLFIPYDVSSDNNIAVSSYVDNTSFSAPVFDAYVLGKYDQRVQNPLTGEYEFLDGILLQTVSSAVVRVSEEGFVVDKGVNEKNRTWFIKVSHANGYTSYYDFLSTVNVEIGQKIGKGEILGQIQEDNTKLGSPTLFFRLEQDGISLDPSLFF